MADKYLRSTDGSDSDNGTTWALAYASLAAAVTAAGASSTVWVSQAHAESQSSTINVAPSNVVNTVTKIISVSDAAEPPTALSTASAVTTTGNTGIDFKESLYVYGIVFTIGSGSSGAANLIRFLHDGTETCTQYFSNCDFILGTSSTSGRLQISVSQSLAHALNLYWKNCDLKFGAAQGIDVALSDFVWDGGSILASSSALTNGLIRGTSTRNNARSSTIRGVDLTNLGVTGFLVNGGELSGTGRHLFENCLLPSFTTGGISTGTWKGPGPYVEVVNCDSGDTSYRYHKECYAGTITAVTSAIAASGASVDSQGFSYKMIGNANTSITAKLETPILAVQRVTTGSSITVTVEYAVDDATTLKRHQLDILCEYQGASGSPLSSFSGIADADVIFANGADLPDSSTSWSGADITGMTNAQTRCIQKTFTPQNPGWIRVKVKLLANKTVWIDPKIRIT